MSDAGVSGSLQGTMHAVVHRHSPVSLVSSYPPAGRTADKTASGITYIPAPKLKLPGHEESYNPPAEYLPTEVSKQTLPKPPGRQTV